MKWICRVCILFMIAEIPVKNLLSQTFIQLTTTEILKQAKQNPPDFSNNYPSINYALPLLDSTMAIEMAKLSGLDMSNAFVNAVTLQCRDTAFRQMLLVNMLALDQWCHRSVIEKSEYDKSGAGTYEYWGWTKNILAQTDEQDTPFLGTAIQEFEFWAPMAWGFIDTIMKSGMHQLTIGKRRFDPCLLASFGNCRLWACCIYLITGKEEYGSSNEKFNDVYKKLLKAGRGKKMVENRKQLVHFRKKEIVTCPFPVVTLDSLDFETIPAIKEQFEATRKNSNWQITIYTHENKGLLYLYHQEKFTGDLFAKRIVGLPSLYFVQHTAPATIELTKIDFGDRF